VALVTQGHQASIDLAQLALNTSGDVVAGDELALAGDRERAAATSAAVTAAAEELSTDQSAALLTGAADQAAQGRLATDRNRLRALVLGVYTGALTGPQPVSLQNLSSDQQSAFGSGEVEAIAEVTVKNFKGDLSGAAAADRAYTLAKGVVTRDQQRLSAAMRAKAAAAARVPTAVTVLTSGEQGLARAQRQLAKARADLQTALTLVAGPAVADAGVSAADQAAGSGPAGSASAGGGLSVLGSSALNAQEIAGWFDAAGYLDLTGVSVTQLANWYLKDGAVEGVRGDVAFAQAVLETGGFASPDAVLLNNYAGIGHCDSCAAGWAFPSPQSGVLGQLQLLRIFADAGPAPSGSPPPALSALNPNQQSRRGCCSTWESLSGVWATDPSYGTDILSIYEEMLAYAAAAAMPGSQPTSAPANHG
jgi:Mannosyl-glycoprotein endo-beta-N-acetylglucosaminidase